MCTKSIPQYSRTPKRQDNHGSTIKKDKYDGQFTHHPKMAYIDSQLHKPQQAGPSSHEILTPDGQTT